jgi:O-antigen/teichoic acid export membrane protein
MAINNIAFNLSAVTINVVDRAIVGATLGAGPAGLYSGPSELALRASGLVRAAVQVILPWAARQGDEAGRRQRIWLAATTMLVLIAGAGCAGVLLVRHEIATLLLGRSFRTTGDLLGLFSITVLMSALGYACIVYLNARGNFSTQRRLYGIAAVALVIGALYGAKQGSLTLVAMAFVMARSVDLVLVATILRECQSEDVRRFLLLGALMTSSLACAWSGQMAPTSLLLAISVGLGLSLWRSIGVASR